MEKNSNGLIKLAGFWKKESEKGPYYSGKLTYSTNILLFPNKFKQGEKDPDLILYIGKAEKKEQPKQQENNSEVPF